MEDGFELPPRIVVGKDAAAHSGTIKRAVCIQHIGTKRCNQRRQGCATRRRQLVGENVGIHHVDSALGKRIGHGTLAAADASGETDNVIAHLQFCGGFLGRRSSACD